MDENMLKDLEIEPLSDDALELVAGGRSDSSGQNCCSCKKCSNGDSDG